MTARDTYVENMKQELDALNDQLSSFETKVTHAKQEARERYALELDKVRTHSQAAVTTLEAMRTSTETSWHQWVSDMDRARDSFIHAFHDFRTRL